jgi:hypothetical protein
MSVIERVEKIRYVFTGDDRRRAVEVDGRSKDNPH